MKHESNKKIEEVLIQTGLRIAKRGEGALFVVGKVKYEPLIEQSIPKFKAIDNPKLLESLGLIDGAVIIDRAGYVEAYGVRIKSNKVFKNYGTRHAAAFGASKGDNLIVLVSEEEKKVKLLKNEKLIMQIDALQKDVERSVSGAVKLFESVGAGTLGTIGTSLLVPTLGISLLPGIVVFGSAYYLGKILHERLKN